MQPLCSGGQETLLAKAQLFHATLETGYVLGHLQCPGHLDPQQMRCSAGNPVQVVAFLLKHSGALGRSFKVSQPLQHRGIKGAKGTAYSLYTVNK